MNRDYVEHKTIPKVKLPTMIRLGLFQMGLGMMSVMVFGVLNRILIRELALLEIRTSRGLARDYTPIRAASKGKSPVM